MPENISTINQEYHTFVKISNRKLPVLSEYAPLASHDAFIAALGPLLHPAPLEHNSRTHRPPPTLSAFSLVVVIIHDGRKQKTNRAGSGTWYTVLPANI